MSDGKRPPASDPLLARVDEALSRWPVPTRTAEQEAEAAEHVVTRLRTVGEAARKDAPSDDELFRSPLPVTLAEVQAVAARGKEGHAPRRNDGSTLRDIAKLAGRPATPKEAEKGEDSGVIVLAELMASGLAADAASTGAGKQEAPPGAPPAPGRRKHFEAWIGVGGAIAGAAVAAAVFLVVQGSTRRTPPAAIASSVAAVTTSAASSSASGAPTTSAAVAVSGVAVDPVSLPVAMNTSSREPVALPSRSSAPSRPSAAVRAPSPVASEITSATAPSPATTGSVVDLGEQMRVAAGPAATPSPAGEGEPAAPDPNNVPRRPSLGAIQGALGAVLPAARLCLGPDDPISRVSITFRSDGSVESVSLEGGSVAGALGKPAEACIRAALGRARVPPFAQPIFTVPATVRPN